MRHWLKDIRCKKQVSMREVAKAADISESYYEKIERGERNVPVPTAKKIAVVLGFSWDKFFEDEPSGEEAC